MFFKNNGAGVAVMFTKNVKCITIILKKTGDSAYGLLLKEIADSYIFNNKVCSKHIGNLHGRYFKNQG